MTDRSALEPDAITIAITIALIIEFVWMAGMVWGLL